MNFFTIANSTPEIMPDETKAAGIRIVAEELLASRQQGVERCKQIYICSIEKK